MFNHTFCPGVLVLASNPQNSFIFVPLMTVCACVCVRSDYDDWRPALASLLQPIPFPKEWVVTLIKSETSARCCCQLSNLALKFIFMVIDVSQFQLDENSFIENSGRVVELVVRFIEWKLRRQWNVLLGGNCSWYTVEWTEVNHRPYLSRQPFALAFTKGDLRALINLAFLFLKCSRNLEKTQASTRGKQRLHLKIIVSVWNEFFIFKNR